VIDPDNSVSRCIFWGNRKLINLRDKGVRGALLHPIIQGKKRLARGVYSVVFEGQDSVFKLTVDRVAYELAAQQADWKCPGLPLTVALHGEIGSTEDGIPLRLIELERLAPLARGSKERSACLAIGKRVAQSRHRFDLASDQLGEVAPFIETNILREAVEHLSDFAKARSSYAVLDLHGGNFMQRPSTGEPVITDPFLDAEIRWLIQQQYIRKAGLSENTVFI
jgi:hypothetical protein